MSRSWSRLAILHIGLGRSKPMLERGNDQSEIGSFCVSAAIARVREGLPLWLFCFWSCYTELGPWKSCNCMILTPECWSPWPYNYCSTLQNLPLNHFKTGFKICPKLAPQWASKLAQTGPKFGPKSGQDCTKICPEFAQNRSKNWFKSDKIWDQKLDKKWTKHWA
jgi:hypothetical protein